MKKAYMVQNILDSCMAVAMAVAVFSCSSALAAEAGSSTDWKKKAISPVANPLFFESPLIESEARPIYMHHKISDDFVGGFARIYAVQLRYAVTERLGIIATKDGYIQLRPGVAALRNSGWADIGAGLKYALIDKPEHIFILTPGFKFELPSGNRGVFQGNGDGEFNLFVSAMKGWGDFHATASVGGRIPVDDDAETSSVHYSAQLDYHACHWFIPFAVVSGQTVVSEARRTPFEVEGFDLINFGASNADGFTQIAVGGGFRSRFCRWADLGFAYERGVTRPEGIYDDRLTVDMIIKF